MRVGNWFLWLTVVLFSCANEDKVPSETQVDVETEIEGNSKNLSNEERVEEAKIGSPSFGSVSRCVLVVNLDLQENIKSYEFGVLDPQSPPITYSSIDSEGNFVHGFDPIKNQLYVLNIKGNPLFIFPDSDTIQISADQSNHGGIDWSVKGSKETSILVSMVGLGKTYQMNPQLYNSKLNEFLIEKSPSMAVAMVTEMNLMSDPDNNYELIKLIAEKHRGIEEFNPFVKKADQLKPNPIVVGNEAPDFSLPNQNGEIVDLSSFRGKYVLVDFWASWCGPCRRENPNVVRNYQKYHGKGLEILGVSLDRSKEGWLRAIQSDGLVWSHVSDLKMWQSDVVPLYRIKGIPFMVLLDPAGKIIAINLRGAQLNAKLAEIFGE
jgi:thiol-disulfide isomerase/thioredoxin